MERFKTPTECLSHIESHAKALSLSAEPSTLCVSKAFSHKIFIKAKELVISVIEIYSYQELGRTYYTFKTN